MIKAGKAIEQIIIVTDQEENAKPFLAQTCLAYKRQRGESPYIVIVNVGNYSSQLEDSLRAEQIEVDTYTFSGDYYSLPSLIPMLSGGSRSDLLIDIMSFPLPSRQPD